jgi:hypothetical protein
MHRILAVALALVLVGVNFTAARPLVPTLPHHSWGLAQWLLPWPVQVVQASEYEYEGSGGGSSGGYIEAVSYERMEMLILGLIIGYLFDRFVDGWNSLLDTFFR